MKILIDTNVLLDVVLELEREPFFRDSDRVLALSEQKILIGYISGMGFNILHTAAIASQLDGVVTRNPKDFTDTTIPIYTPTQLFEVIGENP